MAEIVAFMHCMHCLDEIPKGVSPNDYSRLTVGAGPNGSLIIWCNRHDLQVVRWENNVVAMELARLVNEPCCKCGECNESTEEEEIMN